VCDIKNGRIEDLEDRWSEGTVKGFSLVAQQKKQLSYDILRKATVIHKKRKGPRKVLRGHSTRANDNAV